MSGFQGQTNREHARVARGIGMRKERLKMNKTLENLWALAVIILCGPVAVFVYIQLILIDPFNPLVALLGTLSLFVCAIAVVSAILHLREGGRETDE